VVSRAHRDRDRRRERGASAIEFALVFPLFFGLIYMMISYGLTFALQHSLAEAAKESARSAVACDPTLTTAQHETCVTTRVRATAGAALDFLSADLRGRILGASNEKVQVEFKTSDGQKRVEVLIALPNYAAQPILPTITLKPFFPGPIPPLPERLAARAVTLL
jgi:Flp pilus assembly protein TadG